MAYDPKLSWDGVAAAMEGPGIGPVLNGGSIRIYDDTGTVPENADDSNNTNVLLTQLTFGNPAFGDCADGTITANAVTQDVAADATGSAAYGRYYTSGGTCIFQGLCGTSNSDIVLTKDSVGTVEIEEGEKVDCASATLTMVRE